MGSGNAMILRGQGHVLEFNPKDLLPVYDAAVDVQHAEHP